MESVISNRGVFKKCRLSLLRQVLIQQHSRRDVLPRVEAGIDAAVVEIAQQTVAAMETTQRPDIVVQPRHGDELKCLVVEADAKGMVAGSMCMQSGAEAPAICGLLVNALEVLDELKQRNLFVLDVAKGAEGFSDRMQIECKRYDPRYQE